MMKLMKAMVSMICTVMLLTAIPLTGSAAYGPGIDDLRGCNERIEIPAWYSWLDSYETKYVKTKYGVCAYLRYEPKSDSDYYDYVYEKDVVTVMARQNGYSLVETANGQVGWVSSNVLVSRY